MTRLIPITHSSQLASQKQLSFISRLIFQKAAREDKILTYFNISALENISKVQAKELIDMLLQLPNQEHIENELCLHSKPPKDTFF